MKEIIRILLIYLLIFLIFTGLYLIFLHTSLFSLQKVLFYRGILLMIVDFILVSMGVFILKNHIKANFETLLAAILVSVSINLSIFVVLPVTFERSVTMYLLNTLNNSSDFSCNGLTKKQLEDKLINQYVIENKAINKRIKEQEIIDFIKEKNQCIQLTSKAKSFLKLSKMISKLYGLK